MTIAFRRPALPVLTDCDVAVIGGSFGGCAAALSLARAGYAVTVVEPRTYLGREVTATLRPWIRSTDSGTTALPDIIAACLEPDAIPTDGGEIALRMDTVKRAIEDLLLQTGVKVIYAALPVGLLTDGGRVNGVIIGNKSGRQVIRCRAIIDATATALVVRLAGSEFEPVREPTADYAATLEFTGVGALTQAELPVPGHLGLTGNRIALHTGYRGADHVLATYRLRLPAAPDNPWDAAKRDAQARRAAGALAEYLIAEVPAFDTAYLATSSYELDGPHATPMVGPPPAWAPATTRSHHCAPAHDASAAPAADFAGTAADFAALAADFAAPLQHLWCLNGGARLDSAAQSRLHDPIDAARTGTWLAGVIADNLPPAPPQTAPSAPPQPAPPDEAPAHAENRLEVREQAQPQQGRDYRWAAVPSTPIPTLAVADVLVAGGGTSGAVAGIVAGQERMRTIIVDMNPGLGGTGTYGGIHTYWFGQRTGFVKRILDWVGEMHDRLHLPRPEGNLAHWNIEAKAWVLAEQAEEAGVALLLNATIVAAIVEGNEVRGAVAATRWGPVAILSQVVIDATGDGDCAALSGASHVYGSEREHAVMYAYLPQVADPGRPRNVKTSMLDTTNIEDINRMLLAERRRGEPSDHDHGVYIGPRESRHIQGDIVLTLTDQLRLRSYPDVVYIAFANHDMKGESTSDWIRMGLQAPNVEIEIPLRALVPRDLRGIIVVGKAYSATHDALGAPRMMPDLENLGAVAAIAAAMAVRAGEPVRALDVRALQERLVKEDVLPERVLTRKLIPLTYSDDELTAMIDGLDPHRPLQAYSDADIGERQEGRVAIVDLLCAGPRVVPSLEDALARARAAGDGPRRLLLARLLAMLGSKAGVDVLIAALEEELSGDVLPERNVQVRHAGRHPPDQGSAPAVANLLYCLGMARDARALPVWQRTADLVEATTADALLDPVKAAYYYVSYLAYGAERLGDPRAVPLLKQLHRHPSLHDRVLRRGVQPDFLQERLAYLELLLGRAMARCGSAEGVLILIRYLDDVRSLLAEHAHAELVAITGQDFGKNVVAWSAWLEAAGDDLTPAPYTAPGDPIAAWDVPILVEAQRRQDTPQGADN